MFVGTSYCSYAGWLWSVLQLFELFVLFSVMVNSSVEIFCSCLFSGSAIDTKFLMSFLYTFLNQKNPRSFVLFLREDIYCTAWIFTSEGFFSPLQCVQGIRSTSEWRSGSSVWLLVLRFVVWRRWLSDCLAVCTRFSILWCHQHKSWQIWIWLTVEWNQCS